MIAWLHCDLHRMESSRRARAIDASLLDGGMWQGDADDVGAIRE
jgi:hypothetical protein